MYLPTLAIVLRRVEGVWSTRLWTLDGHQRIYVRLTTISKYGPPHLHTLGYEVFVSSDGSITECGKWADERTQRWHEKHGTLDNIKFIITQEMLSLSKRPILK